MRLSRVIVVGVSLALAAVWLIPGPAVDENRPRQEFPGFSRAGVASGTDFRLVDAALVDRLGAKGDVVSGLAEALIAAGLSPTDEVFRGPSGEPFLSGDMTFACTGRAQILGMDAWSRDVDSFFDWYGVDFLWAVAPDKTSVERDAIGPAADLLMSCSDANRADLEAMAASPGSPMLVGWKELEDDPEPTYLYGDSHWNSHGAAVFAELILDRLAEEGIAEPGVFDPDALVTATTIYPNGGLYLSMGGFRVEPTTLLATQREGVVTEHAEEVAPGGHLTERWASSGPGLIPGRTLVLHDSFWFYEDDILAPYFADLTSLHYSEIATPSPIALIDGYDLVIIQHVQRYLPAYTENIATAGAWILAGRSHEDPAVP